MKSEKIYKMSGLTFFGIAASEVLDSSAEIIDINGCDISDFEKGVGQFNWEHLGDDDVKEGKSSPGQNWVGRIVFAKKIFKKADCDTELEERCWESVKAPFVFTIGRLYDSAGHTGAQALAAIMRDAHKNEEKNIIRMSIEGTTLQRDEINQNVILKSVAKNVALTVKPCNRTCDTWVLFDPNAPEGFDKNPEKINTDILKDIAREMNKSLKIEEFEGLSKKEKVELKQKAKKKIIQSLASTKDPLSLYKKLLPQYESNSAKNPEHPVDANFIRFASKVRQAPITINFSPSKLRSFVQDGRFKTRFEDYGPFDRLDHDERKSFEHNVFGIPLNTSNKKRPVYGALHLGHDDEDSYVDGGAPMYGSAFMVLKDHVKGRSSFTHNDSYAVKPEHVLPYSAIDKVSSNFLTDPDQSDFIEAQIHGGVDFSKDVSHIHVPDSEHTNEHALTFGRKFNVPVFSYDQNGQKRQLDPNGMDNGAASIDVQKTLAAGNYNAAPGSLVGGAALQVEDQNLKTKKIKSLIEKAFEKTGKPKTKNNIKEFVKANLPEISESFIDDMDDSQENLKATKAIVRKAEFLAIEVTKSLNKSSEDSVDFNGKKVIPGSAIVNGNLHYIMDETPDSFIAMPHTGTSNESLVSLPKNKIGQDFNLNSFPSYNQDDDIAINRDNGIFPFNSSQEQHEMLDGLKLKSNMEDPDHYRPGVAEKTSLWVNHPIHGQLFVKGPSSYDKPDFNEAHRELAYHNIGSNFFGLGDRMPRISAFSHPNGQSYTVQKGIKGALHPNISNHLYQENLMHGMADGSLEKMMFMDHVLGNDDRHEDNILHSPLDKKIYFIDHGRSFETPENSALADHINDMDYGFMSTPSHPEVHNWVQKLDSKELGKQLMFNKVPVNKIQETMARFENARRHILEKKPSKVF